MRTTKRQLRRIIKEEAARLNEARFSKELANEIIDTVPHLVGNQPNIRWTIGADTRNGRNYIYADEDLNVIGYGWGADGISFSRGHKNHVADGSVIEKVGPGRFRVTKLRAAPDPVVMEATVKNITKSQLRRIVKEEKRKLHEVHPAEMATVVSDAILYLFIEHGEVRTVDVFDYLRTLGHDDHAVGLGIDALGDFHE